MSALSEAALDLLSVAWAAGCVVLVDAQGRVEIVPDPREDHAPVIAGGPTVRRDVAPIEVGP